MDKKHYYVQNGKLIKAADRAVPKILVGSADDLELIKDKVTPGSEAHTPGYANVWELSPERKWISKVFADEDKKYEEIMAMDFSEIAADTKSIGSWAFDNQANLVTAIFPKCEVIGEYAFQSCASLQTISFPECREIGSYAFAYDSLLSVVDFPKCESIRISAFSSCTHITDAYFQECRIIESSAFRNCIRLVSISFPECTEIGNDAFTYCSALTALIFPKCEKIGAWAFSYCNQVSIAQFPMCKTIGGSAFSACTSLTELYLSSTTMVECLGDPRLKSTASIFVPSQLMESYQSASYWSAYSSQFTAL